MKRSFNTCLIVCTALFFVEFSVELAVQPNSSLSHCVGVLNAQNDEKPEDPRPERRLQHPTQEWFQQLEKITAAIEEEDYDRAKEMLDRQVERTQRWNERELAIFHRRYMDLGVILEDYDLVLEHAMKILEYSEFVHYLVEEQTLWLIARIYASEEYEDYHKSLEYIQRWLDLTNDWDEGSKNYAFIAGIYTNVMDFQKTEEWMTRAIDRAEEEEIDVPEHWWVQLRQAYIQLSEAHADNPIERDKYRTRANEILSGQLNNERKKD